MANSGARWLEMSGLVTPAGSIYNRHEAPGSEAEGRFGDEVRDELGLEPAALTASQAVYILGFRDADGFRASVAKARGELNQRLRQKGLRSSEAEEGQLVSTP